MDAVRERSSLKVSMLTSGNSHFPVLVGLFLLLPLLFGSPSSTAPLHLGLPRVFGGDEPHYLVMINSMILDGDLDLANNYAAVHRGSPQAGDDFSGSAVVPQTVWYEGSSRKNWDAVYETGPDYWDHDNEGHPVPRLRAGQLPPSGGHPEFSVHPPGVALLLAPILFPFRGTQLIEPLAICCSAIAIILAMLMFRSLIRRYNSNLASVDLVTAVTFLGTPAWHYGRTLYNEPYLLLFAIGSYSLALRGKNPILSGILIGLGMLMKPPFALLIIPLFSMYVVERQFSSAAVLVLPAVASLATFLWLDFIMFGSPWRTGLEWQQGSFLRGASGAVFSLNYGYLIIAPAITIAIAAWPCFFRAYPRDAIVLMSGIVLYFILFASWGGWTGASCYAARYMVPILPLLFTSLASLSDTKFWQMPYIRPAIIAICALSVVVNGIAAIPYWEYWNSNPLYAALQSHFTFCHEVLAGEGCWPLPESILSEARKLTGGG
jgi:hypothetical protein